MKKLLILWLLFIFLILWGCFTSKFGNVTNNNSQSWIVDTNSWIIEDNSGTLDENDSWNTENIENNTETRSETVSWSIENEKSNSDSWNTLDEEEIDNISLKNAKAEYSNNLYRFQFTMPDEWADLTLDYKTSEDKLISDETPYIAFAAKTTDENWSNNQVEGFPEWYAELFRIWIIKKSEWIESLKTCDKWNEPCLTDSPVLWEKDENIFVLWLWQDGPSDFTMFNTDKMKTENPIDLIKKGFSTTE